MAFIRSHRWDRTNVIRHFRRTMCVNDRYYKRDNTESYNIYYPERAGCEETQTLLVVIYFRVSFTAETTYVRLSHCSCAPTVTRRFRRQILPIIIYWNVQKTPDVHKFEYDRFSKYAIYFVSFSSVWNIPTFRCRLYPEKRVPRRNELVMKETEGRRIACEGKNVSF